MSKKVFYLVVLALSLALVGCGRAEPTATPEPTAIPEPTATPFPKGWDLQTYLPTERYHFTANVVEGKIYVIGGYDSAHFLVEVYDPETATWTKGARPRKGRAGHASCVVGGKIYVFGGDEGRNWIDDVEVYDPATDTWTAKAPIPPEDIGAGLSTCSVVDDIVYLIGGITGEMNMVWAYDPADDSWESKSPIKFERISAASAVVDGKILVFGGCRTQTDNPCDDPLEVVEEYDPQTDTWTTKAPMPTARFGLSAVALGGKVYVLGGGVADGSTTLELYDPATDTWDVLPEMPASYIKFASVVLDGQIYVVGEEGVYTFAPGSSQ